MTPLSFQSTLVGDVAVVALTGELDVAGASLVEDEIDRLLSDHSPSTIVLDLSQLSFMDSTGLRLVVLSDQKLSAQGRRFALIRGSDEVHKVFEITRMAERLEFVDSPEDTQGGTAA